MGEERHISPSRSWNRTAHLGNQPASKGLEDLGSLPLRCQGGVPPTSDLSVLDTHVPGTWQGRHALSNRVLYKALTGTVVFVHRVGGWFGGSHAPPRQEQRLVAGWGQRGGRILGQPAFSGQLSLPGHAPDSPPSRRGYGQRGAKSHLTMEQPDRDDLSQMTKVSINSDQSC